MKISNMLIAAVIAASASTISAPASAQWDPGITAQGQVLGGMNRGYAERGGWRDRDGRWQERREYRSGNVDRRTCRNVSWYAQRYGRYNAHVQNLIRRCRWAGYPIR